MTLVTLSTVEDEIDRLLKVTKAFRQSPPDELQSYLIEALGRIQKEIREQLARNAEVGRD